jgi:hypothetical protein
MMGDKKRGKREGKWEEEEIRKVPAERNGHKKYGKC